MKQLHLVTLCAALLVQAWPAAAQTVYPTGTTVFERGKVFWGYTYYNAPGGTGKLVTMRGSVIQEWDSPEPDDDLFNSEPLFDTRGHVLGTRQRLVTPELFALGSRIVTELDWDGNVVFEFEGPELLGAGQFAGFHHDLERLPNGNTLALCALLVDVPQVSSEALIDDCIVEISPAGEIVWEWYTFEHFAELGFDETSRALIDEHGGDWAHANAIAVLPANNHSDPRLREGNILIGYRSINTIAVIDRDTGSIVWKMGPGDNRTIGQHNPHMIPLGLEGAGDLLVLDNGGSWGYPAKNRLWSRVAQLDFVTKVETWQYAALNSGQQIFSFFTPIISSAQRLRNGNTLVVEGTKGRIFEVTADGEIVWEYVTPFSATREQNGLTVENRYIYRAYRVPFWWRPR